MSKVNNLVILIVAATVKQVLYARQQSLIPQEGKVILRAGQLYGYSGPQTIIIVLRGLDYTTDDQREMLDRAKELSNRGASLIYVHT